MYQDVKERIKNKEKLYFTGNSACLQPLVHLVKLQGMHNFILWILECVESIVIDFNKAFPKEKRPRLSLNYAKKYINCKLHVLNLKSSIDNTYEAASQFDKEYKYLCKAIAYGCNAVYHPHNWIKFIIYSLQVIVLKCGEVNFEDSVTDQINYYYDRLLYWQENAMKQKIRWIDGFLGD